MTAFNRKNRKESLRVSFYDGIFASIMIGLTQDYFTPFMLFLGGAARQVGFLSSLPNVVAALVQLKTADIVRVLGSRRRVMSIFVFLQALTLLIMALLAYAGKASIPLFVFAVVLFTSLGAIATPAWGSLMSDLIPARKRGAYFGWRNSILGIIIVSTSLGAGLALHLLKKEHLVYGFPAIFAAAFLMRVVSWIFLRRMHDPGGELTGGAVFGARDIIGKIRGSNFARFAIFVSLMSLTVNIAGPYFTVLMIRDLGFSYLEYSAVIVTAPLVMYTMMGRWGKLADRVGNVRVLRFTAPIIAIIPLLWIINRHPVYLLAAQVVSGFAWAGFNLCASNFIFDAVPPEKRVRYISYFNVMNGIMLSAGALVGGFAADYLPPLLGYRLLTLLLVSSLLRIVVLTALPLKFSEVRTVHSINSNDLFFSIIGIKPMIGVERHIIRYLNPK